MMTTQQGILAGILAIAALVWSWISRGRQVQDLNQQLKLQPGQTKIDQTKEQLDVETKKAAAAAADYAAQLASNPELAAKLGIGKPNPGRDSANH